MQKRTVMVLWAAGVAAGVGCWIRWSGGRSADSDRQGGKSPATLASTNPATTPVVAAPAVPTAVALPAKDPSAWITDKDIAKIDFDELPDDTGLVTPLAKDLDNLDDDARKRLTEWATKLNDWPGAADENVPQRVRNLMSVCALSDLAHAEFEGELGYVVFEKLKSEVDKDLLIKAAAWVVLKPAEGKCPTKVAELGWEDDLEEEMIRERAALYAQKLLGRLMGKLPKKDQ